MDFTLNKLIYFLRHIKKSGYSFGNEERLKEIATQSVLLRHDIDKNIYRAFKLAKIEFHLGIKGVYYFRISSVLHSEIIREIHSMGHEIGYHYENYSNAHGDLQKAIASFQRNLEKFRQIVPVKTICMDGRPLSKYNNLDLWKYYNYRDYGIEFEPYLDVDFSKVLYLTDTGRGWNLIKYSVRDKVSNPFNYHDKTTKELIHDLESGKLPDKIMITIHPQRWNDNIFLWVRELLLQRVKNTIKWCIIKLRD